MSKLGGTVIEVSTKNGRKYALVQNDNGQQFYFDIRNMKRGYSFDKVKVGDVISFDSYKSDNKIDPHKIAQNVSVVKSDSQPENMADKNPISEASADTYDLKSTNDDDSENPNDIIKYYRHGFARSLEDVFPQHFLF